MALFPKEAVAPNYDFADYIQYDPATHLVDIPGEENSGIRLDGCTGGAEYEFTADYSFFLGVTEDGKPTGGIFNVFGAIPALGIEQPTELLA